MENTPQESPLSQLLAMIQKTHENSNGVMPSMPNNQVQAPPLSPYAGQGSNGGTGNPGGVDIMGLIKSAGNLQTLPWLSDAQNFGSMGSSLVQGASGSAGMGGMAGSALSALASMFV